MCQINLDVSWLNREIICGIITCCYLLVLSIQDIRERVISGRYLAAGAVAAVAYQIIVDAQPVWSCLAGVLMGGVFIGISKLTRESLGYGDSFLIAVLGLYLGIWNLMYVLVLAFTMASLYSVIVLIRFRYHKKKTLPFVPFLTAGHIIFVLFEVL